MSDTLDMLTQSALRDLARSGKHVGWRSVAFELQFEPELSRCCHFGFIALPANRLFTGCTVPQQRQR